MTTEERLEANNREIDKLISLASKHGEAIGHLPTLVEAQDRQIEALIIVVEKQRVAIEQMAREWQAYIKTLPRQ